MRLGDASEALMSSSHRLAIVALGLFAWNCGGCSAVFSEVDQVEPVYLHGQALADAETPAGFVVTVDEISQIVPLTKHAWNIYADRENYYLSSAIQKFSSKSGDNSWLARTRGIRIRGCDRSDMERLETFEGGRTRRRFWEPAALRDALSAR